MSDTPSSDESVKSDSEVAQASGPVGPTGPSETTTPPAETPVVQAASPPPTETFAAGRALYERYYKAAEGRNHRGEPLPAFEDLSENRQSVWEKAAAQP